MDPKQAFNKIDSLLVAGFQLIVNTVRRKPRWFCKHLATLMAFGAVMRPFENHDLGWMIWIGVTLNLTMALVLSGVARLLPDEVLKREHPFWRWFWLAIVAMEFIIPPFSFARLVTYGSLFLYFCFAACDNPPPPKRKEEKKPLTVPPLFGTLSPTPNHG